MSLSLRLSWQQTLHVYPKFHLLVFTYIFTFSSMYILVSTFIMLCMYLYLMHIICWAVSVYMGNNAILHPIKLIGSCIQLIKLNCIIIKTTQADALLSIKGLIIKFSSTVSCMVISVHNAHALLSAICLHNVRKGITDN